jgi:hypothetical protein
MNRVFIHNLSILYNIMSSENTSTPAEILILSAVKSVGKREFLKTVDLLFNARKPVGEKQERKKSEVPADKQCAARVKGDRTGLKAGRHVLFEATRCARHELASDNHLCPIHTNQTKKFGSLAYGKVDEALTDAQKKVFGEL